MTTAADIDHAALLSGAQRDLEASASWPVKARADHIRISSGFIDDVPCRSYRSDVDLDAPLGDVVAFIADEMIERLPDWNREFIDGRVHEVLDESATRKSWLVQVFYETPWPFDNREYLYYLAREQLSDDEVMILYRSVDDPIPVRDGFVRGVLYRTVHRCLRIGERQTKLEHILANDIAGLVPQAVQSYLFAGGFVAANMRDAVKQRELLRV